MTDKKKTIEEEGKSLGMAMNMMGMKADQVTAEVILMLVNLVREKGNSLSVADVTAIEDAIQEKYPVKAPPMPAMPPMGGNPGGGRPN